MRWCKLAHNCYFKGLRRPWTDTQLLKDCVSFGLNVTRLIQFHRYHHYHSRATTGSRQSVPSPDYS